MESNRIISSLCYFSIFFAGFILPVAVYCIVDDSDVKEHAKRAFISHLIPLFSFGLFFFLFFTGVEAAFALSIAIMLLFGLLTFGVVIWNVVKGIVVLKG